MSLFYFFQIFINLQNGVYMSMVNMSTILYQPTFFIYIITILKGSMFVKIIEMLCYSKK